MMESYVKLANSAAQFGRMGRKAGVGAGRRRRRRMANERWAEDGWIVVALMRTESVGW